MNEINKIRDMVSNLPERKAEAQHEISGRVLADLVEDNATGSLEVLAAVRALVARMGPRFAMVAIARLLEDHPSAVNGVRLLRAEPPGPTQPCTLRVRNLYENPLGSDRRAVTGDLEAWILRDVSFDANPGVTMTFAEAAEVLLRGTPDREAIAIVLGQNPL